MKCSYVLAALFAFQTLKKSITLDVMKLANAVDRMKNKNVRIENVDNIMQCTYKCLLRPTCKFVVFELFTEDIFTHTDFKCSLSKTVVNVTEAHNKTGKCPNRNDPISMYPKVIAGACSDHGCADGQKCHPRKAGGYTCDRERGRKKKRKSSRKHGKGKR